MRARHLFSLRRAWVQITHDLGRTEVSPTVPLDLEAMAQRPFAVNWLGPAAMLLRVGGCRSRSIRYSPKRRAPVAGFGPARLTPLPVVGRGP